MTTKTLHEWLVRHAENLVDQGFILIVPDDTYLSSQDLDLKSAPGRVLHEVNPEIPYRYYKPKLT